MGNSQARGEQIKCKGGSSHSASSYLYNIRGLYTQTVLKKQIAKQPKSANIWEARFLLIVKMDCILHTNVPKGQMDIMQQMKIWSVAKFPLEECVTRWKG